MKRIMAIGIRWASICLVFCFVFSFTASANASTDGQYQVDLKREAGTPLSPEKFYEVVFFTARTVFHTLEAVRALEADDAQTAVDESGKARALIAVVGGMLPTAKIDMRIKDDKGNVVYEDERRVQAREIPIYQGMTNVQVVQPIIKFKKRQALIKGYETVNDVEVYSQVWVDIEYLDDWLVVAQGYLGTNKIDEAYGALTEALFVGVRVEYAEVAREYADAVRNLVLAASQADAGDVREAVKSLKKARNSFTKYAKNESLEDDPDILDFLKEIKTLEDEMRSTVKPGKIRALWYKLVKRQPRA